MSLYALEELAHAQVVTARGSVIDKLEEYGVFSNTARDEILAAVEVYGEAVGIRAQALSIEN